MNVSDIPQLATCAVLVDGENISCRIADEVLQQATRIGEPVIRRVYGNAVVVPGWESQSGFSFVHTGCGKNSADLKLAIDAIDISYSEGIDGFVIVTSDGDFTHLAHALRERGQNVLGIGEDKAPDRFRKACTVFVCLKPAEPVEEAIAQPDMSRIRAGGLTENLIQVIRKEGASGIKIASLNATMRRLHDIKISSYAEKTWQGYLSKRPQLFSCDPKGPDARVRLTKGVDVLR